MNREADKRQEIQRRIDLYFNPSTSKVSFAEEGIVKKALGFELTDAHLVGLVGAPSNSQVIFERVEADSAPPGFDDPEHKTEALPDGLRATITNEKYIENYNTVFIYYNHESATVRIYIGTVDFLSKNFGVPTVGALMTRSILNWAGKMPPGTRNIDRLQLMAAGGRSWGDRDKKKRRWVGYNVWPKCGFDMELYPTTKDEIVPLFPKFPHELGACRTVRDVLKVNGGREFWAAVGDGWLMEFDVADAPSLDWLDKYLIEGVP